jgi:RimJ/RimL family protein N-acetyltransferase
MNTERDTRMDEIAPLPEPLPDDLLALRAKLPLKPDPVTLTGKYIELRPTDLNRDLEPLYRLSNGSPIKVGNRTVAAYDPDESIWRFMFLGPFDTLTGFEQYIQRQIDAPNILPFTVFDLSLNHPVGMATYISNVPNDLKIELGSIWYSPIAQRTPANTEATYLMLAHAFDLGYQRV